jgi:hypothetical protein
MRNARTRPPPSSKLALCRGRFASTSDQSRVKPCPKIWLWRPALGAFALQFTLRFEEERCVVKTAILGAKLRRWRSMLCLLALSGMLAPSAGAQEFDGLYRSVDKDGTQRGGVVLKIEYNNDKLTGEITLLGEFKAKGKLQGEYSQGLCFLRSDLGDFVAYASANCDRERIAGTLNVTRKGQKQASVTNFSARARVSGLVQMPLPASSNPEAVLAISKPVPGAESAAKPPSLEAYAAQCASVYRHGDSLANCINSYSRQYTDDSITGTDLRYLNRARRCYPGLNAVGLTGIDMKRLAMECEGRRPR